MNLIGFLMIVAYVNVGVWASDFDCNGKSILKKPIERIFSRKKRFLLLPTGASMKITVAVGKALISRVPRGLNLSIEFSAYYPMPTTVQDWYIKKWKTKTPPIPKPKDTYIYIPGTNLRYPAKTATKKPPVYLFPQPLDPVPYAPAYKDKPFFSPWVSIFRRVDDKVRPQDYASKYSNQTKWDNYSWPTKAQWTTKPVRKNYYSPNKWYNYKPTAKSYENWDNVQDWKYYHGHRDRRDIYNHLEGLGSLMGLDMKMCVLRAICESKRFLLPPGYSLIQDIVRIVFSMPTLDGMDDEYSNAMRSDDCVHTFRKQCSFSIIDYVLKSNKRI